MCLVTACCSCFFLDKILEKLKVSVPDDSMEVDGDGLEGEQPEDPEALVKDCKFNMKLRMADSAWKQVFTQLQCPYLPLTM